MGFGGVDGGERERVDGYLWSKFLKKKISFIY